MGQLIMLEPPSVKTILTGFLTPFAIVLIFAIAWNVMHGRFYMIWEDECGKGNGQLHVVHDERGGEILRYRFDDFGNTNDVYEISINDKGHRFPDHLSVNVEKRNDEGCKVCAGVVLLRRTSDGRWLQGRLPPQFAPGNVNETIEMDVIIPSADNSSERTIKLRLRSRKVWSFPSV